MMTSRISAKRSADPGRNQKEIKMAVEMARMEQRVKSELNAEMLLFELT